jgi:hypothetical protein
MPMCSDGQRMNLFDRTLDALLRWPLSQASLAGPRRIRAQHRVGPVALLRLGGNARSICAALKVT